MPLEGVESTESQDSNEEEVFLTLNFEGFQNVSFKADVVERQQRWLMEVEPGTCAILVDWCAPVK